MRRRPSFGPTLAALVVLVGVLGIAMGSTAGAASTAQTTITATIQSATSLNATGCAAGTATVTDFGGVMPGSSTVTSTDCTVIFGSNNDTSMLRAYQTDASGSALIGMPNGALDTTFDTDGKTTTAFGVASDGATGTAIQADGKVVVAGFASVGATQDFAVARYNTNGSLDNTFDTDGSVTTPILAGNDNANAVAMQPDGKIVLAGSALNGAQWDVAVARYNTNGSLDNTFDTDGIVTTPILAGNDSASEVTIQADGKIVVVGYAFNGTDSDFAIVRYNTNGSLDNTFDTDGKVTTPILANEDIGAGMVIQTDGKIVVAGYSANGAAADFAAARYNANGGLDNTFDTDGKVTTPVLASDDIGQDAVIQPDGKIVVVGSADNGTANDIAAVRYNTNGSLDNTFDTDGKLTTPVLAGAEGRALKVQADGKIVATGFVDNGSDTDFAAVRYTATGSLDNTFDTDGIVTTPVLAGSDSVLGMAIQADGKIVAAGNAFNGTDADFAVVRYGGGGAVADWSGSWAAADLFAACLHTVSNASATWTLAGNGNCTTAINANWNALPTTASKIAWGASGVTNATANVRYGFKAAAAQAPGAYAAPLTFEVVAPNA